ncbi:YdcF family protein [Leptolyngbya iicbica LK]|uniref:YdcF family protein n=2 Tax=Cyanophyceae TaxID=3028117 RepID=A0A4Q7EH86_9CYAN|nr:YdcF family protein [Leptolyngbya sp. LK]
MSDRSLRLFPRSMVLELLTRILVWAAMGLFIWYVLLKFIPRNFLTWFGGAIILTLFVLSFIDPNDETIGSIWQIISLPLTPLGATLGLLILALAEKKIKGRYVSVAFAILLVASVPLFARTIVNQAEQAVQEAYRVQQGICEDVCPTGIPTTIPLGQVVVEVVIAENMDLIAPLESFPSRIDSEVDLDPILVTRLASAARLEQRLRSQGSSPLVYVTAGPLYGSAEEKGAKENTLRQILISQGVPSTSISVGDAGMNIHGAMRDVKGLLEERGILPNPDLPQRETQRVALVAPALSMRRAALTFEKEGLQVIAWPTNLYGSSRPTGDTLAKLSDLVPSVEALRLTSRYWNEVLTSFYYFLRGWLPGFNVRWNEVVELVPDETP